MERRRFSPYVRAVDHIVQFAAEIDISDRSKIGSNFERLVKILTPVVTRDAELAARQAVSKIEHIETSDLAFAASVKMVAEDIANSILRRSFDQAAELLEQSGRDVILQTLHLRLDLPGKSLNIGRHL